MRPLRARPALLLSFALAFAAASGSSVRAAGKVETIGAFSGTAPDWIKSALEPQGYRATLADGTVANEVWFRKDFPGLKTSAFVGVITFPKDGQDFRGQKVNAGTYSLRYAKIPEDGDHLGASPTPTFALLIPIANDDNPAEDLTFKVVAKMSAKTSGTNHPAPMNLADVSAQKDFPAVATNGMGHEVLYVKLKGASGDVPLGLVVKGRTEHE